MSTTGTIPLASAVPDQTITSALWNAEFSNIGSLLDAAGAGGHSSTDAEMQLQTNPAPGGVLSHPSSIAGELERIRYVLAQMLGKTNWTDPAANGNTLSNIFITGELKPFAGTSVPTGYLLCDGTSYLRTDYAALFTAIGTAWGSVDGTHFNVPDLRGKSLYGKDGGALFTNVGSAGGAQSHTHNVTVPASSHSHTVNSHSHTISHKHVLPIGDPGVGIQIPTESQWGQGSESNNLTHYGFPSATAGGASNYLKSKDSDTANSGNTSPGTDSQTIAAQTPTSTGANPPYATVLYIIKS